MSVLEVGSLFSLAYEHDGKRMMSRWKSDDKCCLVTLLHCVFTFYGEQSLTSKLVDVSW